MWVKWTMTLVKLEGPLETDTWLLNESCSGLAWPPSPRTHFSSQILENRQRKTGNSQTQPLALKTKCKIFFFLSHFLRDRVFFKDSLNISRKPLTFFCFGKKSLPSSPSPLWIRALKGTCIEVALSASASGPIGDSGWGGAGWRLGTWEGETCFQIPSVPAAAPLLPWAPISSVAQRELTQNTHTNRTAMGPAFCRTAQLPQMSLIKSSPCWSLV